MVARLTTEELKEQITEKATSSNKGLLFILIAGLSIFVGFGALVVGISWIFAYLWNVGISPLGVPTITWWQWTIIWFFILSIKNIFKKDS